MSHSIRSLICTHRRHVPGECIIRIKLKQANFICSSAKWYGERVKLAVLHFNTLALLSLLNLREERWDSSVNVIGRQANAVKRKMTKADHEWRSEVGHADLCFYVG